MPFISVVAIVVLVAAALFLTFAVIRRRDEERAVGHLSRETRGRDHSTSATTGPATGTGRALEQAAAVDHRHTPAAVDHAAESAAVPWFPIDPTTLEVNRRRFLNRGIIAGFALGLSGFGGAALAYVWPEVSAGFGSTIKVGKIVDINAAIQQGDGFYYFPAGLMWITNYPASSLSKAEKVYSASELTGMEAGLVALYQKCVHLGCRVPACLTSQWFECPCHGSQYNQVGEKKGGPAPRGLDRFAMAVKDGEFIVNTGLIILGPPIGTNTTGQEAEGPHCITGGEA